VTLDDFREFIKAQNMYPTEKNLALLFERFNKSGNKAVTFEEYQQAVTPFLSGLQKD
jgi:Ca2+-binding EF-hand superfamily protein